MALSILVALSPALLIVSPPAAAEVTTPAAVASEVERARPVRSAMAVVNYGIEQPTGGTAVLYEPTATYADSNDMDLHIWLPSTFVAGRPIKWMVYTHGNYDVYPYFSAASAGDFADVFCAAGWAVVAGTDAYTYGSWMDGSDPKSTYLDEVKAKAQELYPELRAYLPCLAGFSCGGNRVAVEIANHADRYTAFAASSPLADSIEWYGPTGIYTPTTYYGQPGADDEAWEWNSPTDYAASRDLHGRRIWIKAHQNDGNVAWSMSNAFAQAVAANPGGDNLYRFDTITDAAPYHREYFADDGGAGLLAFFDGEFGSPAANTPPVLASIGNRSLNELSLLSFTARATDVDVPADTLTFSLGAGAPIGAAITAGGTFTFTPTEAQGPGTYPVTVNVSDGEGGTDSETITITVAEANTSPVLATIGDKSVNELSLLSFQATATDTDLPVNTLTFSLGAGAPTGAAITSGGAFTFTPTEAQGPGSYPVTLNVSDGEGGADSETITVTVAEVPDPNMPPVLAPIGSRSVNELEQLSFLATGTDADGDPLVFSLAPGAPAGAGISPGGAFTWSPTEAQGPGSYPVTIVVSDGTATDSETITITVNEAAASDTTPPSVPTGVSATALSASSIRVSWTASTDASGIREYRVYLANGTLEDTVAGTSATIGSLSPGTSYTFYVRAVDNAGNVSANSATASATTPMPLDTVAPVITVLGVADGGVYTTNVAPTFAAVDAHDGPVAATATLNGAAFTSGTVVTLAGSYTLVVTAKDVANNTATKTVAFTINAPEEEATSTYLSVRFAETTASSYGIPYGASPYLTVEGILVEADNTAIRVTGQTVDLWTSFDGTHYTKSSAAVSEVSPGLYSVRVKVTQRTWYRLRFGGSDAFERSLGRTLNAGPKAWLTAPVAPSTMDDSRAYGVSGYLKPRHSGSPVKIYAYQKVGGTWTLRASFLAKASNYSTYSRYVGSIRLPNAGAWRIRAYHRDNAGGVHYASYSSWRYITVK